MDDLAFLRVDLTFHGHWHSFQVQCEAILAMKRPAAGIRRPAAAKAAALPAADDVVRTYPVCAKIVAPDLDRDEFKNRIRAWVRETNDKPITISLSQNEKKMATTAMSSSVLLARSAPGEGSQPMMSQLRQM